MSRFDLQPAKSFLFAAFVGGTMGVVAAVAEPDPVAVPQAPCRIQIVEKGTGWPVPLVELRTTHLARFVSDNAGNIAFDMPELMGRDTWFDVIGHGYGVKADGFGSRGVRLRPEPGGTLKVEVERSTIAKRIGRLTGGGLFAESQRLGLHMKWRDSGILGSDSVQNAVHRGRLFWLWGDTTTSSYPLGIFHGTSATTPVQPLRSFQPPLSLRLNYFTDKAGLPRGIATMPGDGPTWVTGYVSLPDYTGTARLVGSYTKIHPPLEAYEWGLAVWNDETCEFEQLRTVWRKTDATPKPPPIVEGHPIRWRDEKGKEWILFGNPLPVIRCPATFEGWSDQAQWEPLEPQKIIPAAGTGAPVKPHSGSAAWNGFRNRWVTVFMESFGKPSVFGEIWYAEADSPTGPWGPAVKILSHSNYTFYNPRLHPEFTPDGSAMLFFEGTFTQQFADRPPPTPRYDYNQILYRLDLDDPALAIAGAADSASTPAAISSR